MPLHRRLPKRGFKNLFAKDFETINIERLAAFEAGSAVTADGLKAAGVISRVGKDGVKILGRGELGVALHVRVAKLTQSAAAKVLAAGGTIEGPVPGE
jgi:large subunit ribosomal protein L15